MPKYRIHSPHTFVDAAGQVHGAGELIELASDVAATHAHAVELVPDEPEEAEPAPTFEPLPLLDNATPQE